MINEQTTLTPGQLRTRAAREAALELRRRRRLDEAAAMLHASGWLLLMPGGTRWNTPGDAR